MVQAQSNETSITWADINTAGQAQKVRFPRSQAIRSLWFFFDASQTITTAATEVLSSLEAIDTINIKWDEYEVDVRGQEIAVTQWAFGWDGPEVGFESYRDTIVAASQGFDSCFRLPVGATQDTISNLEVTCNLAGEAFFSETVANTAGSGVLYVVADYVDAVSVSYSTWSDSRAALNAETEFTPPKMGDTLVGFSVVCFHSATVMTANGAALNANNMASNYDNLLTGVRVNMGNRMIDVQSPDIYKARGYIRVKDVISPTTLADFQSIISMQGMYWVPVNLAMTAIPRIKITTTTTNPKINVWFSYTIEHQTNAGEQPRAGSGSIPGEADPSTGMRTAVTTQQAQPNPLVTTPSVRQQVRNIETGAGGVGTTPGGLANWIQPIRTG